MQYLNEGCAARQGEGGCPGHLRLHHMTGTGQRDHPNERGGMSLKKLASTKSNEGWLKRELSNRNGITSCVELLEPVPILLLILLDGVSTHGQSRTNTRPPNGLAISGVLAPWTTSNLLLVWSPRGA